MRYGKFIIYIGTMGAGKTTALLSTMDTIAKEHRCALFKPSKDGRFGVEQICTHDQVCRTANAVSSSMEILELVQEHPDLEAIGIDEAQFFDDNLPFVIRSITALGVTVFASGLPLDAYQRPFGSMPTLMVYADEIYRAAGKCEDCKLEEGKDVPSYVSYYMGEGSADVGGMDDYVPLCRRHAFERDLEKLLPEKGYDEFIIDYEEAEAIAAIEDDGGLEIDFRGQDWNIITSDEDNEGGEE